MNTSSPSTALPTAVLSAAIASSVIGGILIGLIAGLLLRPLLNHSRLNPKQKDDDLERQKQEHELKPNDFRRVPAYIPPSTRRLRDSRPVYQIRPEATVRPPPRTLQLGRHVTSISDPTTEGQSKRISFLQNRPATASVDRASERVAAPPCVQRASMCRSTIEYISSPPTSTDAETSAQGAQRSRSASSASAAKHFPAATLSVPSESILPHPWNARLASTRPGTAESEDSSRFLPQPLDLLAPMEDSTVDEMSVRMTSEQTSWDSDIAREPALDVSPEADTLKVPTTLASAVAKGEERPLSLLETSTPQPARPSSDIRSSAATEDQRSSLWSQETTPSAWEYDGAMYWQRRNAWQKDATAARPETSPLPSSSSGQPVGTKLRHSRRETTIGTASSLRYSRNTPLLLFLPPASSASSTHSEASERRGSGFVRSSDETWGEDEEMTRSSSAAASEDANVLATSDELETEHDRTKNERTSVDGMLNEMLMIAPMPDWRPIKSTTTSASALSVAHTRAPSTASTATTIQLRWQTSQDTVHSPLPVAAADPSRSANTSASASASAGARASATTSGASFAEGYRSMDPPDSPRDVGVDSESDESSPELKAGSSASARAGARAGTGAAAGTATSISTWSAPSTPILARLVFQRPATPHQSRRPRTAPVDRVREAHHVLAPPALGSGSGSGVSPKYYGPGRAG